MSYDILFNRSSDCPIEVLGTNLVLNRISQSEQGVYTCVGKETDVTNPKEIRARTEVFVMGKEICLFFFKLYKLFIS